jgi:hypothetical protein
MTRPRRYLCLLLSVPGILVIFLPFTEFFGPVTPLEHLREVVGIGQPLFFTWALAAGSLLAIPIALWHVRSLIGAGSSVFEQALALVLSTAAMSSVIWAVLEHLVRWSNLAEALLWLAIPILLALINVAWLARSLVKKQPFRAAAERFLVLGYLPNATLALLIFNEALRSGAAMAGIACACYLAMVVLLSADRMPGREDVGAHA